MKSPDRPIRDFASLVEFHLELIAEKSEKYSEEERVYFVKECYLAELDMLAKTADNLVGELKNTIEDLRSPERYQNVN